MIKIEVNNDGDIVEVFLDKQGRDDLLRVISRLVKQGDHDHLMTQEWGGWELVDTPSPNGYRSVKKLTIGMVDGVTNSEDILKARLVRVK